MSGKGKANHSKSVRRKIWQYKHADFDKANDLLMDIQPNDVLDYSDIERSWHNWKQVFLGIMEECIPCSTLPNRKNLPWLTKHIIQLIRKRNNLFKRAQRSGDPRDYQSYKEIRNKVVSGLRTSKQNFFATLNPQCPRDFWKMIKQLNPNATTFPALAFENVTAYTDRDKANILNHASMRSNHHSPHQTCYNWTQMNAQLVSCVQKKRLMNYLATLIQPRQMVMMTYRLSCLSERLLALQPIAGLTRIWKAPRTQHS